MAQAPRSIVQTNNKSYTALLVLCGILALVALSTLLPYSAQKQNDLGYYSLCSFVPWSTLSLLVVAGVIWAIRQYLRTRAD